MGQNTFPFVQIVAPASVYVAPVGTAFPDLDESPANPWALLAGPDTIDEGGVTTRHTQTINTDASRTLGSTLAKKAFRTAEKFEVEFTVKDLSAAVEAMSLDLAKVPTQVVPGVGIAGHLYFEMVRGLQVGEKAVLVRYEASPEASDAGDDFAMQFDVYRAVNAGSPAPNIQKDAPGALQFTLEALEDADGNWVTKKTQDAAALSS